MALQGKLAKKLKAAQDNWAKARTRAKEQKGGGGFDEIDDGRYIARLTKVEVGESKSSGRLQAIWTWKVEDGDYKGAEKRDFDGLETEDNLVFLARKLARFGYEVPEDLEEVIQIFEAISKDKPLAKIRLKTRGEFQNVYIDRVFDPADEEEVLGGGETETEEEEAEEEAAEEAEETEEEAEEEVEEEVEEEEAEDEGVELEVGMHVETPKGNGKVLEILEKDGKARVKLDDANKIVKVNLDDLTVLEDSGEEEEEEEEVPEKPAPVKKPVPTKKPGKK